MVGIESPQRHSLCVFGLRRIRDTADGHRLTHLSVCDPGPNGIVRITSDWQPNTWLLGSSRGGGWVVVGAVLLQGRIAGGFRRSRVKSLFASRGFGPDVYDLMVTMRGGGSRITLLENMETPRNRLELSELTGIDWREVDREISILEKYGLVKIYAQTGTVKMYQVTEQGKLLMNLVGELSKGSN